MENLRETLKLLFLRQSGNRVVKNVYEDMPSMTRQIDSKWFIHEFPDTIASYSYDQKEQICKLLKEKWIQNKSDDELLSYSNTPTIFNALHYFTSQCLKVDGDNLLCKYESLLRWHELSSKLSEDLFLTSYYAGLDLKAGKDRSNFAWKPVIDHDDAQLGEILAKPLADIHFHLMGSSCHFDINWLAVMNHPEIAEEIYKNNVWYPRKGIGINKYVNPDDLFVLLIKACAIRLFLYRYLNGISAQGEFEELVKSVLIIDEKGEKETKTEHSDEYRAATGIMSVIPELQNRLSGEIDSAFKYVRGDSSKSFVADYAISKELVDIINKGDVKYIYTVLAGERHLMYSLFKRIYQGADKQIELIEKLFYAYLVIKGIMRHEMIQLNNEIGLMNFTEYDVRKNTLSKVSREYPELMKQMAIRSFFDKNKDNYLEVRIQPHKKADDIKDDIKKIDKNVENKLFCEIWEEEKPKFWYILYLEKEKDSYSENFAEASCRHQVFREKLREQAKATLEWKYREGTMDPNRIVGIDAVNSECYCRPEVFAQVFRYLRNHKLREKGGVKSYKFTYHVGEDFYDIVDGLRAIDEALTFLELNDKDRLGHALALGIDVKRYYMGCSQTVVMRKQTLLDNIVWLLMIGEGKKGFENVKPELVNAFKEQFSYIFDINSDLDNYQTYLASWYLRADEPSGYKMPKEGVPEWTDVTEWTAYEKAQGEIFKNSRNNPDACNLNHRYHYDFEVKNRGEEACEFKVSFQLIKFIETVQEAMLEKVSKIGISIECCPTSNLRIGPIRQYREHPIFRFNNSGLTFEKIKEMEIPVTINTDDKGIFATSLEREYSLLGCALYKDYQREESSNTPEMVYNWLDGIRENGFKYKFEGD